MRKIFLSFCTILTAGIFLAAPAQVAAADATNILFHIKTDLGKDDAQICVAYNMIWAALREGGEVSVLIDASAVNTYKRGWSGKDALEGYKLPGSLRREIARQFGVEVGDVPATYGDYLNLLHSQGAKFYINGAMLVVSGISETFGDLSKISAKFFQPVTLAEMLRLFKQTDRVIVY